MRLLVTGASGRLGTAIYEHLSNSHGDDAQRIEWMAPRSSDLNVTEPASVEETAARTRPDVILHAAAETDVAGAEQNRDACWRTNVLGTRAVADAAARTGARLIHVSTDYVFWGGDDRPPNGYRETDPVGPVRNYYALTKLVAEEAARRAPRALIVRTSFRATAWPHPSAFGDVYTGQDYVDVIATEFGHLLQHLDAVDDEVLHIVTERKSVYDLIRRRTPDVRRGSRADAKVDLPEDVSLDTSRWQAYKERWSV